MAGRGWSGSVAGAIGVAAGAGAAQLGLGYGLGIIVWSPSVASADAGWLASLAWATWIAATSTIAGAIHADRLSRPFGRRNADPHAEAPPVTSALSRIATALWHVAVAMAAAVGALVTVALVAVPARSAVRPDTFSPQTIAAGYAVLGILIGLVIAVGALSSTAVAINVVSTVSWLWLLAVIAVVADLIPGDDLRAQQLGMWQFTSADDRFWLNSFYWPGVLLSLGAAFLIGLGSAWIASRRSDSRIGVAVSGAVGPSLMAAAYFLAAPSPVGFEPEQVSAYLAAPYAMIAGLVGSVLVTGLVGWRRSAKTAPMDDRSDSVAGRDASGSAGGQDVAPDRGAATDQEQDDSGTGSAGGRAVGDPVQAVTHTPRPRVGEDDTGTPPEPSPEPETPVARGQATVPPNPAAVPPSRAAVPPSQATTPPGQATVPGPATKPPSSATKPPAAVPPETVTTPPGQATVPPVA